MSDDNFTELKLLDIQAPLSKKLSLFHDYLQIRFPAISHIAVTAYDAETDSIKTFLDTSPEATPLRNYQAKLSETYSLNEIIKTGTPRIINDLDILSDSRQEHTKRILQAGYQSSYTLPMFYKGDLYGFIFFNSRMKNVFNENLLSHIDPLGRLFSLIVVCELRTAETLSAAVRTTRELVSKRDCETGAHLERMSRYCRLIAQELASSFELTDEYIEYLYLFSPMHDIGKIAIPDRILLKPMRLTNDEYEFMKTHTTKGLEMVNQIIQEFKLTDLPYIGMLRNIVLYHHESVDGNGYPDGLQGDAIPAEARIVTTADIFDALTSRRPYKQAWSNDETYKELKRLKGSKLDADCVDALCAQREEVEEIQAQFVEATYG